MDRTTLARSAGGGEGGNGPLPSSSPAAPTFDIARFDGHNLTAIERQTHGLDDLGALLTAVEMLEDKKQGRLWSPVRYRAGATTRSNAGVEAVTCLVYDCDHTPPDWTRLASLRYFAHTTWTHRRTDPRYRLILPLTEPVPVERWADVWQRGRAALCSEADPACKDPSRAYYLPAARPAWHPEFTPPDTRDHPGVLLDPATLPPLPPDVESPGRGRRTTGQQARPATDRDRYRAERYANVVVTSLAEMAPDSGRNDALNRAAWVLGGWVAAGALELDAAEDALYGAAEANGLVEDDGEAQCWRTIRSGLAAGLRSPVDLDADNAPLIDVDAVLRSDPITGEVMSEADLARVLGAVA